MPDAPLARAQAAHRAGRQGEALSLYRALADDGAAPVAARAAALHGIAVLRAPDAPEQAVRLLREALALAPALPQAGEHLGTLLAGLGRAGEAITAWRAALAAAPGQPALWGRLAALLRAHPAEGAAAAVGACRHGLAAHPEPEAAAALNHELGLALLVAGRPEAAVSALLRARSLDAGRQGIAAPLGAALLARGEPERAVPELRAALAEQPADLASRAGLARALLAEGAVAPAIASLREGLALSPGDARLRALLARGLVAAGRPGAALATLTPPPAAAIAEPLVATGLALAALGRPAEALARFTAALALSPDDAEARHQAALCRLTQGDFAGGWPDFALRDHAARHPPAEARLRQPRWTGEQDLAGRRILLYAERSLADAIQFLRYVPMVAALGARVALRVPAALHALAAAMPALAADPAIRLLAPDEAPGPIELRAALADLPHAFATTLPTVPAVVPYLAAPAAAEAPRGARPVIALCAEGARLPADLAGRLAALPAELVTPREDGELAPLAVCLARADLVIAGDGPTLHLAGALARPTLALLPSVAGWRWLIGRRDSPWYPTLTLLRGATDGAAILAAARRILGS